ncbi:MAG: hypothetical protein OJF50_006423 [Nitrospira sp.]|nr:hypothetical protein [Nitrospira sp.]
MAIEATMVLGRFPVYGLLDQLCLLTGAVLFALSMWLRIADVARAGPSNAQTGQWAMQQGSPGEVR